MEADLIGVHVELVSLLHMPLSHEHRADRFVSIVDEDRHRQSLWGMGTVFPIVKVQQKIRLT